MFKPVGDWSVFTNVGDAMAADFGPSDKNLGEAELSKRVPKEQPVTVVLARQEQVLTEADGQTVEGPQGDTTWLSRVIAKKKVMGKTSSTKQADAEVVVNGFMTASSTVRVVKIKQMDGMSRLLVDLLCDTGAGKTSMVQFGFAIPTKNPVLEVFESGLLEMLESAKDARAALKGRVRTSKPPPPNPGAQAALASPAARAAAPPKPSAVRSRKPPPADAGPTMGMPPPAAKPTGQAARTHDSPYANTAALASASVDASATAAKKIEAGGDKRAAGSDEEYQTQRTHDSPYANVQEAAAAARAELAKDAAADPAPSVDIADIDAKQAAAIAKFREEESDSSLDSDLEREREEIEREKAALAAEKDALLSKPAGEKGASGDGSSSSADDGWSESDSDDSTDGSEEEEEE